MLGKIARKVIRTLRKRNERYVFNRQAQEYEKNRAMLGLIPAAVLKGELDATAHLLAGKKLALDAGCGTGLFATTLLEYAERVVAFDIATNMLNKVPADRGRISRATGDIFQHPFRPGVFDLVLCSDFLHHTGRHQEVLKRISSLLCNKGVLVVTEYDPRKLRTKLVRLLEEMFLEDLHLISPKELEKHLSVLGFRSQSHPISSFEYLVFAQKDG